MPTVTGLDEMLQAIRDPGRNLREKYADNPLELAARFGIKLPRKPVELMIEAGELTEEEAIEKYGPLIPGLRELVDEVCNLVIESAAVVGPRGGGKSLGVAFIEFYLWIIKLFDALNLGGSELQADQVYQYLQSFLESDPYWLTLIRGDPLQSKTETVERAWVRVLTASQKSVRSPHAGGKKSDGRVAGGILVIDEEAEAEASIVQAALPTINTARPSVNVRSSTFHNIAGSFADLIDNHQAMGYKLFKWDIFDVCEKCECKDECESDEDCFREDHFETYIDPSDHEEKKKLVHRAYCGGKARYAEGWIPVAEIVKLWKRMKRSHSTFEVECMGSRPTTSGHVIKDLMAVARNTVQESGESLYVKGSPVTVVVDWGTKAAGVSVWQEQFGGLHVPLHAEQVEEAGQTQIFGVILGHAYKYKDDLLEIAADIGGGGNYLNPKLREEYNMPVRDVNFNEEKEVAVAAWNIFSEADKVKYPAEHEEFMTQIKNWKRNPTSSKITKGNDHICDSAICYFAKFVDQLHIRRGSITGVPFRASTEGRSKSSFASRGIRIPVAMSFSQGRKKK
jgi:hypothetical protein